MLNGWVDYNTTCDNQISRSLGNIPFFQKVIPFFQMIIPFFTSICWDSMLFTYTCLFAYNNCDHAILYLVNTLSDHRYVDTCLFIHGWFLWLYHHQVLPVTIPNTLQYFIWTLYEGKYPKWGTLILKFDRELRSSWCKPCGSTMFRMLLFVDLFGLLFHD